MKARIPAGTREERVAFMREWIRQRRADQPGVRLSRARRRVAVAGLYLLLLTTLSALGDGLGSVSSAASTASVVLLVSLGIAQLTCFMVVNYSVRGLMTGEGFLDERERALRDRATAIAYRLLTGVLFVVTLYAIAAGAFKAGPPSPSTATQLFWLLIPFGWLAASLPQSVLAWTLPDPEPLAVTSV